MYKNWDKKTANRFLLATAIVFVVAFFLTAILIFGLENGNYSDLVFSNTQKLVLSFLCALIPVGSICGFCVAFIRIDELPKNKIILMILFCVPMVALFVPFGIVMLVPTILKCLSIKKS